MNNPARVFLCIATLAASISIQATTFTRVAGTNTAIPSASEKFASFDIPRIRGSNIVFSARGAGTLQGFYKYNGSAMTRLVDTTMTAPNGGVFSALPGYDGQFSQVNDFLFQGNTTSGPGLFRHNAFNDTISLLVDTNVVIPGRTEKFRFVRSLSQIQPPGRTVFVGYDSNYGRGIYFLADTNVSVLINADQGALPGTTATFTGSDFATVYGDNVAFYASRSDNKTGIYCYSYSSNQIFAVADTNSVVPGRDVKFSGFADPPALYDGTVVFHATFPGGAGLFSAKADGTSLTKLVDTDMTAPGTTNKFMVLYAGWDYCNGRLLFFSTYRTGPESTISGLYMVQSNVLTKVIDTSDTLDGQNPSGFGVGNQSLDPSGNFAFMASFGHYPSNSSAIYSTLAGVAPTQYTLTKNISPVGYGTISANPGSADGKYNSGSVVQLTAMPAIGKGFAGWSGAGTGKANPISITMSANKSVTALFTNSPKYKLTTSVSPSGTGSILLSPTAPTNTYSAGTVVSLTATPSGTNIFAAWLGDVSGVTNRINVTMTANKTASALFNNPGKFIFQNTNGQLAIWFMQNTQRIATAQLNNGLSAGSGLRLAGAADIDSNRFKDLFFQTASGQVQLWRMSANNKTNTMYLQSNFTKPVPWRLVAAADMNKDAKLDVLWQNTNGVLHAWLMNGFTQVSTTNLASIVPTGSKVLAVANFDGVGSPDFALQNANGSVTLWLMNNLARTSVVNVNGGTSPGTGYILAGAGDVSGDGKNDLIFQKTDGTLLVWVMNGTTFSRAVILPTKATAGWTLRAVK